MVGRMQPPTKKALSAEIRSSLKGQGFRLTRAGVSIPPDADKDALRRLHDVAVAHRIERGAALESKEPMLINHIADGREVDPGRISPRLAQVMPGSEDELLFRYVALHWSIPVSSGYGRRIRFLVRDEHTDKLIGVIGLGDPVFALQARDQWVGWNPAQRNGRLRHVVDAYVLGAVPPYSRLLGGKLVAMLALSQEVRTAFEEKYAKKTSLISGVEGDSRIALVTTTSALGRSSVYNRLRFGNRLLLRPVGFTRGSGEFHFANGLYDAMKAYAWEHSAPTAKHEKWGNGFRSRREVVKKTLKELDLPMTWSYHGVEREIFVGETADNSREFLRGETNGLAYYPQDKEALFGYFQERWLWDRLERDRVGGLSRPDSYIEFRPQEYLLWGKGAGA